MFLTKLVNLTSGTIITSKEWHEYCKNIKTSIQKDNTSRGVGLPDNSIQVSPLLSNP